MSKVKLIGLEHLPNKFKIYLDDDFRKKMIWKAVQQVGGFVKLSKKISFDWSSLCKVRRGYRIINGSNRIICFIRVPLLKKLLQITNIPLREAEKNIIYLAYNKAFAKTRLPIFASPQLASLVGHAFGDGHASSERFKYVNQRKELVEEVITYTKSIFGYEGRKFFYNGCYCVEFPGVVGRLLSFIGAPLGRKVTKKFEVPFWIKNGTKKIKSSFLRALFDDEGSIINNRNYRFISISMYKQNKLVENHLEFLNQIRKLLNDLEINPTKVSFKKNWNDTKEFGFRIYNKRGLINFAKNVNFKHNIKNQKLIKVTEGLTKIKSF